MDLTWLGHACFRLRGKNAVAVTDPYPNSIGMKLPKLEADVVTVSHAHDNHRNLAALRDGYRLLEGPGEYEVAGVTVIGVNSFHDAVRGQEHGRNTIFMIEVDDVRVCHLGDLGHKLGDAELEALGTIDVLLAPVGGGAALEAVGAAEVVRQIEPRVVVPMHYAVAGLNKQMEGPERFLKEMGVTEMTTQAKLSIGAVAGDVEMTRVVVLEPRP